MGDDSDFLGLAEQGVWRARQDSNPGTGRCRPAHVEFPRPSIGHRPWPARAGVRPSGRHSSAGVDNRPARRERRRRLARKLAGVSSLDSARRPPPGTAAGASRSLAAAPDAAGSSSAAPAGSRGSSAAPGAAGGSGFDAIVGNPPFAGKNSVAAGEAAGYPDWLKQIHPKSHGNADLVAHFFRRAFTLVRRGGTSSLILIATNTIAQRDTRSTGLRWICTHGGEIYNAQRRSPWPGQAAVVVSVVHVHKGPFTGPRRLDHAAADPITAFLLRRGGHDDPARLAANTGKSHGVGRRGVAAVASRDGAIR